MHVVLDILCCNFHALTHDHCILSRMGRGFLKFHYLNMLTSINSTQTYYRTRKTYGKFSWKSGREIWWCTIVLFFHVLQLVPKIHQCLAKFTYVLSQNAKLCTHGCRFSCTWTQERAGLGIPGCEQDGPWTCKQHENLGINYNKQGCGNTAQTSVCSNYHPKSGLHPFSVCI